jgi:tetratricopeptide (TPR) repeat protein
MADYQNSGYWWHKTGELVEQMNKGDQFIYYNNLGNDHYFQQHYSLARDCFIKAAELVKGEENRKWDYYTALTNLGEIYVCLGQADPARVMIAEADSFFRKVNLLPPLYYLETERIELTLLEGHTQQALQIVNHCEFSDVSIPAAKLLRLKAVEQVMRQTGNYQRAYEAHQQLHALNDSIQNAYIRMQMSTRMLQYNHDKRLLAQEHTIDYERMKGRLALALFAVSSLTIGLLCMFILEWRRRQKLHNMEVRQQIVGMRMENTRNRITPHFIYNALTHEMLAQMEGRKVNLESLTQLLRRGIEQADMLETTLAEELSFVDYYVDIERQQMPLALFYEKEIGKNVNLQAVKLPAMTIQIYVENAIKHGLKRQGGMLTVRISRKENATLVEVIDNGQGLDSTYQEHTGMRVVRQTILMLNERNQQQITFGIGNIPDGCRSWLLLPDDYNYNFTKI